MGSIGNNKINTGIPSTMPTKQDLLNMVKSLKGNNLKDAIYRLDSLGTYYREDKRQQRGYLTEIISNIYEDDPAQNSTPDVTSNYEIIEVVTGINRYSPEFTKKFGRYDMDRLYERARKK